MTPDVRDEHAPGGPARRILARLLQNDDWSREFLAELDAELERMTAAGRVRSAGTWYARQLLSPTTLRFLLLARRRRQNGARVAAAAARITPASSSPFAGLAADLRQSVRSLAREPRISVVVVLMLALGVGSVTSIYGVSKRLFLSGPPHVQAPDELVRIFLRVEDAAGPRTAPWIPYATARAIQDNVSAFADVTLYRPSEALGRVGGHVRSMRVVETDARYFDLLGVVPRVGRFPVESTGDAGSSLAVVSEELAVASFGSAAGALGQTLELGSRRHSIVGVAPYEFAGPHVDRVDVWIPTDPASAATRNWWAVGRLAEGGGSGARKRASAEADRVHHLTDPGRSFKWALSGTVVLAGIRSDDAGEPPAETRIAQLLLAMVSLLLVIACANAMNLLMARMTRRKGEVIVRLALGISRGRLARLVVSESLILGLAGGALAIPVAFGSAVVLRTELLPQIAWKALPIDLGTALWAGAVAVLVALATGLVPARHAARTSLMGGLGSERQGRSRSRVRGQLALVATQVALSTALLMAGGLFLESFWKLRVTNLGVSEEALAVRFRSLDDEALGEGSEGERDVYARALETVRALPGMQRAALTVGLPFLYNFSEGLWVPGFDSVPELPGGGPYFSAVSGGYFDAVGTPIVRGTPITDEHVALGERVMVVSGSMAATLWPGEDPLGQCVRIGAESNECSRVVGVAGDAHRQGYREPPSMQFYVPLGQERPKFSGTALVVRPSGNAAAATRQLSAALASLDPTVDQVEVVALAGVLDPQIRPWRLGAVVLSLTAGLAVVISLLGVYSVLSHLLAQRRREIGVRLTLGAPSSSVRRLMWRTGLGATAIGVGAGLLLLLAGSRWLEPRLFETSVADPIVMLGVVGLLFGGALVACAAPAREASRVDPLTCLKTG